MSQPELKPKYDFKSLAPGLPKDTFRVYRFEGREYMSSPYEFKIILAATHDFDPGEVMNNPVKFTIFGQDDEAKNYHGILCRLEETHEQNGFIFYRAVLVPKIYVLTVSTRLRVFVDITLKELFKQVMEDDGLFENLDFEFRLQKDYPKWDFITQYRETTFNFITRWMEREGIYFYIEQTEDREKVIFTDTLISHRDVRSANPSFDYCPPSGMSKSHEDDIVWKFQTQHNLTPDSMFMKDYNYERPALEVEGRHEPPEKGRLFTQDFGLFIRTPSEGKQLSAVQGQARDCQRKQFHGESSVGGFSPGAKFTLNNHYREGMNKSYLLVEVTHKGQQIGWFCSSTGFKTATEKAKVEMEYRNTFTAIEATQQYRMLLQTSKPLIAGVIHGVIDAEGQGEYAEMDDKGRYKVRLKFDQDSKHRPGRASAYLRMQQPYGGPNEGMHMPLRKGTEVSLVCTGGDPDRMEISGVVSNPNCQGPVTSRNPTESVISTKSGNLIAMDDQRDQEGVVIKSRNANSFLRLGAPPSANTAFTAAANKTPDRAGQEQEHSEFPPGIAMHTTQHSTEKVGESKSVDVQRNYLMTADDKNSSIQMQEEKGVDISSQNDISLTTQNDISLTTHKDRNDVTFGDHNLEIHGKATRTHHGETHTIYKADSKTDHHGKDHKNIFGDCLEFVGGHMKNSVFAGVMNNSVSAAALNSSVKGGGIVNVSIGEKLDLSLALAQAIKLDSTLNIILGLVSLTVNLSPIISSTKPLVCIEKKGIKWGKSLLTKKDSEAQVKDSTVDQNNGTTNLGVDEDEGEDIEMDDTFLPGGESDYFG